jgi:hypothetical protein
MTIPNRAARRRAARILAKQFVNGQAPQPQNQIPAHLAAPFVAMQSAKEAFEIVGQQRGLIEAAEKAMQEYEIAVAEPDRQEDHADLRADLNTSLPAVRIAFVAAALDFAAAVTEFEEARLAGPPLVQPATLGDLAAAVEAVTPLPAAS